LICALIHTPQVILLDEPTNGVDPVSRRDFWRILYSLLAENVAILISTSYLDEAERCHRVALLHQGRLLYSDTPAELKKKISGDIVAVISPESRRLRDLLRGSQGLLNLVLVGDGLHLMVDDASRRVPELRARIESANLPIERIAEVAPTIEDLFVQAVEKEGARTGSG